MFKDLTSFSTLSSWFILAMGALAMVSCFFYLKQSKPHYNLTNTHLIPKTFSMQLNNAFLIVPQSYVEIVLQIFNLKGDGSIN